MLDLSRPPDNGIRVMRMQVTVGRWARPVSGRHGAPALRLFCFPYAGAGASIYHDWRLPGELTAEVWAIEPPGRESRRAEPVASTLAELIDGYHQHLTPLFDRPFAFFGHSLGALTAYELTRLLRRLDGPQPTRLFLSGYSAPHRPARREPISPLPDDRFISRMLEIAGPSRSAIRDPELLLLTAPVTRADCRLYERHRYAPDVPLAVPVTCYAAVDDCEVAVADIEAWRDHTTAGYRLRTYRGGHLFMRDHRSQMLADIAVDLLASRPALPPLGR
jgi:medium-chain acyl-[acyl-carrier-protein] hydrolase